jgi:hypothetical protein
MTLTHAPNTALVQTDPEIIRRLSAAPEYVPPESWPHHRRF